MPNLGPSTRFREPRGEESKSPGGLRAGRMRSRTPPPRPHRVQIPGGRPRSGTPRPTGMSRIQRAGTSELIRPRASRLWTVHVAPSTSPSRSPLNRTVLNSREAPASARADESVGRAERAYRDRLSLVRRLALLRHEEDRRVCVFSEDRIPLLHAQILEVARRVPPEPGLLVEDEPARPDAEEVRGKDAVQNRDVAPQLGLAPFFRQPHHVGLGPGPGVDPRRFA